jgi:hypothetical protein
MIGDRSPEFHIEELIREQAMLQLREEVPHAVAVNIERWSRALKTPCSSKLSSTSSAKARSASSSCGRQPHQGNRAESARRNRDCTGPLGVSGTARQSARQVARERPVD